MDLTSGYLILFMAFLLYYPMNYLVVKRFLPTSDDLKHYRRAFRHLHTGIAFLYSSIAALIFNQFTPEEALTALLYLSFSMIITCAIGSIILIFGSVRNDNRK